MAVGDEAWPKLGPRRPFGEMAKGVPGRWNNGDVGVRALGRGVGISAPALWVCGLPRAEARW